MTDDVAPAGTALDAEVPFAGPDLQLVEQVAPVEDDAGGRVVDLDGKTWNLRVPGAAPVMVAGAARWFATNLSRSGKAATRKRTNRTNRQRIAALLAFGATLPSERQAFGTEMLDAYFSHVYRKHTQRNAWDRYNTARAAALFLMKKNVVPQARVPRNKSKTRVNSAPVRSGRTFATVFKTDIPYGDANAANEDLLAKLRDLLWIEIEGFRGRPDLGTSVPVSNAFSACVFGLLSAACVNPTSIAELRTDDLRRDSMDRSLRRLRFHKGRAGGEVDLPPFPVGDAGARTVPRLWDRALAAIQPLRDKAPPGLENRLLLRYTREGGVAWWDDAACGNTLLPVLRGIVRGEYPRNVGSRLPPIPSATAGQERYAAIRDNAERLSFALTRATAINVANARLRRDLGATERAIGHRPGGPTAESAYLNNAQYREDLDHEVRRGLNFMDAWVREPARMLPSDPGAIQSSLGVDRATAERAAADEFNLGMGASLVDGRTVVIDTALNALRMMQWTERLRAAEERMLCDNPDRWNEVYVPQLVVFDQALQDFSYRSRQGARRLQAEGIELPFPEVV